MDRWMSLSVSMSTAEVVSSRIIILGFVRMARARQRSCLWPCERLSPPSETVDDRYVDMFRGLSLSMLSILGKEFLFAAALEPSKESAKDS